MPELPSIAGGPYQVGSDPTVSAGVDVTLGRSSAKGAWQDLMASTTYGGRWLMAHFERPLNVPNTIAWDIGVGAVGQEQIIVPDLLSRHTNTTSFPGGIFLLPVSVPRGVRLCIRGGLAANQNNDAYAVVHVISSPLTAPYSPGRCEAAGVASFGPTLLADPGATPGVKGAWTQLLAATGFAYRWMCVWLGCDDTSWGTAIGSTVDIGIGAAGQEQVVIPELSVYGGTADDLHRPQVVSLPVAIPAGVRLVARSSSSVATAAERQTSVAAWGVA